MRGNVCRDSGYQLGLNNIEKQITVALDQRGSTGGQRATSGPRLHTSRSAKLFVNLLVSTNRFIFFALKGLKKIVILILPAA
jgi:hypothetical protein